MSILLKLITWGLSYIANALILFNSGKQHEKIKNQQEQLNSITTANTIESSLKRDATKLNKLRKLYKR